MSGLEDTMLSADDGVPQLLKALQGGVEHEDEPGSWEPVEGFRIGLEGAEVEEVLSGIRLATVESPDSLFNHRKTLKAIEQQVRNVAPPADEPLQHDTALTRKVRAGLSQLNLPSGMPPHGEPVSGISDVLPELLKRKFTVVRAPHTTVHQQVEHHSYKHNDRVVGLMKNLLGSEAAVARNEVLSTPHIPGPLPARPLPTKLYTVSDHSSVHKQPEPVATAFNLPPPLAPSLDVVTSESLLVKKGPPEVQQALQPAPQQQQQQHTVFIKAEPQEVRVVQEQQVSAPDQGLADLVHILKDISGKLDVTKREGGETRKRAKRSLTAGVGVLRRLSITRLLQRYYLKLRTWSRKPSESVVQTAGEVRRRNRGNVKQFVYMLKLEGDRRTLRQFFTKLVRWAGWRLAGKKNFREKLRISVVLRKASERLVRSRYYAKVRGFRRPGKRVEALLRDHRNMTEAGTQHTTNPITHRTVHAPNTLRRTGQGLLNKHGTGPIPVTRTGDGGHKMLSGFMVTKPDADHPYFDQEEAVAAEEKQDLYQSQQPPSQDFVEHTTATTTTTTTTDIVYEMLAQQVVTGVVKRRLNVRTPLKVNAPSAGVPSNQKMSNLKIEQYIEHHNAVNASTLSHKEVKDAARKVLTNYVLEKRRGTAMRNALLSSAPAALAAVVVACYPVEIEKSEGSFARMHSSLKVEELFLTMMQKWTENEKTLKKLESEETAQRCAVASEVCEFHEFLARLALYRSQAGKQQNLRKQFLHDTELVHRRSIVLLYARAWDNMWSSFITSTTKQLLMLSKTKTLPAEAYRSHGSLRRSETAQPASVAGVAASPHRWPEELRMYYRNEDHVVVEDVKLNLRVEDAAPVPEEVKINLRDEDKMEAPPVEDVPVRYREQQYPTLPLQGPMVTSVPDPRISRLVTDWFQGLPRNPTQVPSVTTTRTQPSSPPARSDTKTSISTAVPSDKRESETTVSGTSYTASQGV